MSSRSQNQLPKVFSIHKLHLYVTCVFQELIESQNRLQQVPSLDDKKSSLESFLVVSRFDTDIQACLNDPKKALSYQSGGKRKKCVIISFAYDDIIYGRCHRLRCVM